MANTIQTGPYEILIRFCCEPGETYGHFRAAHLATKSFVVDDTGMIVGGVDSGASDQPKDFPQDQIIKYLGDQFAAFNDQLTTAKSDLAAANEKVQTLTATVDQHVAVIEQQAGVIDQQTATIDQHVSTIEQLKTAATPEAV
jgi:flagellar motility protein MotE (MotC chaperone)